MVSGFRGRARFVSENYGESDLARRFGVTRYPAIFVNDVLVATPSDFGFFGSGEGEPSGRYAPLKSAASHERFRADLERMIGLLLEGRVGEARAGARPAGGAELPALPAFTLRDLDGAPLTRESLAGRPVLLEFWATWCPPCRGTLAWLGDVKRRWGDRVAVVAIAVESDEAAVRKLAAELRLPLRFAMGQPQVVRAFGGLGAVPTLFLFAPDGRTEAVYYGAPPTLHAQAEAALGRLAGRR